MSKSIRKQATGKSYVDHRVKKDLSKRQQQSIKESSGKSKHRLNVFINEELN